MRKRLAGAILATGAAVVAVMLTVTNAVAAPATWTASPGGAIAVGQASTTSTWTDATASQSISCTSETGAGTFSASASGSPAVIGNITSAKFSGCTDGFGDTGWSFTSSGTWNLNAYHYQGADGTGTTCAGAGVTCGTNRMTRNHDTWEERSAAEQVR